MTSHAHEGAPSPSDSTGAESVSPLLKVSTDRPDADTIVVEVAGEVDVSTAPTLIQALEEAVHARPARLVVNLHEVSFLGSAGLSALVQASREGQEHTELRVVADSPVTHRPLTLMGLDAVFKVCESLDAALAR